jgi:hypothetical protein
MLRQQAVLRGGGLQDDFTILQVSLAASGSS